MDIGDRKGRRSPERGPFPRCRDVGGSVSPEGLGLGEWFSNLSAPWEDQMLPRPLPGVWLNQAQVFLQVGIEGPLWVTPVAAMMKTVSQATPSHLGASRISCRALKLPGPTSRH